MPIFLQPVTLPKRCFLQEALYWVAFQRLPTAAYDYKGEEFRETDEVGHYEVEVGDSYISDEEAQRAGISRDPRYVALVEEETTLGLEFIDRQLSREDLDPAHRHILEVDRKHALKHDAAVKAWWPEYESAIEYPASLIFVALREGRLTARGRPLPAVGKDEALDILESENRSIYDIRPVEIAESFWALNGMNFAASAATNGNSHYCHISIPAESLLAVFPGRTTTTSEVRQIGDSYILSETAKSQTFIKRGRPSYPWERFHLEAAELISSKQMPQKKEAAIEHFQSWFVKELGVRPSRAAIGEKLKPYYDRFIREKGQKIS